MNEMDARLTYVAQQRDSHANDAAGWAGKAESLRADLEAMSLLRDEMQKKYQAEEEERIRLWNALNFANAKLAALKKRKRP